LRFCGVVFAGLTYILWRQSVEPYLFDDELDTAAATVSSSQATTAAAGAAANSSEGGVTEDNGVVGTVNTGDSTMKHIPMRRVVKRGPHGGTLKFKATEVKVSDGGTLYMETIYDKYVWQFNQVLEHGISTEAEEVEEPDMMREFMESDSTNKIVADK
jgi:hypothetical protein